MSEEEVQAPPTTEETPAETPAATDDQPAVTEVTEVTPAEGESEPKPKEEAPKEGEAPKEVTKEEPVKETEVKEKPKPVRAKVVDYRTSKAGWVQKQGLIFKKWQRQYMSLDEEDSVLRWWKTENRTGSDGALFMKFCADVSEPKAEATTTWPDDTADRCFVVSSPYRAFFLVAESPEEKNDWIQKLTAAKEKYNTEGRKVITNELISVEGIKAAFDSGAADLDKTAKDEGIVKEKKAEDAPPPTGEETAPAESGEGAAQVTVEVNVEPPAAEPPKQEEPPKEDPPKEETPAEEPPKEETPAEEPPKEETPAEEPPKTEETPKEEAPASTEGGEAESKAED